MSSWSAPVASLTVQRFAVRGGWMGMQKMGRDGRHLRRVPGLEFYKLLGTGRGADLTLGADLGRWARFAVWSSREAFESFEQSAWRQREHLSAAEEYTLLLRPVRSRGRWSGIEPFGPLDSRDAGGQGGPVAVLTRASIRPLKLAEFWRAVPGSQRGLHDRPGLMLALGMGELPLVRQATFSVWRDAESVRGFAGAAPHREAVMRTRTQSWYAEELFARFVVLNARGVWGGQPLLIEGGGGG